MNFEKLRQYAPQILQLAHEHGITRVFVFGSVARGESTPRSDVDLLVEMKEDASLFEMAGFGYEAEKLLKVQVDVIPTLLLPQLKDQNFASNIRRDAAELFTITKANKANKMTRFYFPHLVICKIPFEKAIKLFDLLFVGSRNCPITRDPETF